MNLSSIEIIINNTVNRQSVTTIHNDDRKLHFAKLWVRTIFYWQTKTKINFSICHFNMQYIGMITDKISPIFG